MFITLIIFILSQAANSQGFETDQALNIVSCHLCSVVNIAAIPAKAGIHSTITSRTSISDYFGASGFPLPRE